MKINFEQKNEGLFVFLNSNIKRVRNNNLRSFNFVRRTMIRVSISASSNIPLKKMNRNYSIIWVNYVREDIVENLVSGHRFGDCDYLRYVLWNFYCFPKSCFFSFFEGGYELFNERFSPKNVVDYSKMKFLGIFVWNESDKRMIINFQFMFHKLPEYNDTKQDFCFEYKILFRPSKTLSTTQASGTGKVWNSKNRLLHSFSPRVIITQETFIQEDPI